MFVNEMCIVTVRKGLKRMRMNHLATTMKKMAHPRKKVPLSTQRKKRPKSDSIPFAEWAEFLAVSIPKLPERERDILRKRFDEKKWTLAMLGEHYGISRQRVRQIEQNALRKLRKEFNEKFTNISK